MTRSNRRNFLWLGTVGGATLATACAGAAWCQSAAPTKLGKATVQYTETSSAPHMDCDDCIQFVPGASPKSTGLCKIVEGEISPHGHCVAFSPLPKKP
jgi:hypothetical protein